MLQLTAQVRTNKESTKGLFAQGLIPAVFYGFKKDTTAISVNLIDFKKIWKKAGESSQVTLKTPEGDVETLIHDLQLDPVSGSPIHVDFLVIDTSKEVVVSVALEFEGISEAVRTGLGSLVKVLHEVEVSALPKDLPHAIVVDISKLVTLDDQIHISDIGLPSGVTMVTGTDEVVALVTPIKEEVEEAPIDLSAIEVEKKGKKDEEAEPTTQAE